MKLPRITIFYLLFLANSGISYALLPEPIENFFVFLFESLPEGVRSDSLFAIAFFKFLIWILVFAVMFASIKKVFHDNTRIATSIALVMSLIGVIMIPNRFITIIFELYAIVIAILVIGLPVLLIWFFNREIFGKEGHGWTKGLVFILAAALIMLVASALSSGTSGGIYYSIADWMEIGAVALFIMGIIMFFDGAGGMVKGGTKHKEEKEAKKEEEETEKEEHDEKKEEADIEALADMNLSEFNRNKKTLENLEKILKILTAPGYNSARGAEVIKALKRIGKNEKNIEKMENWEKELFVKFENLKKDEYKHLREGDEILDALEKQCLKSTARRKLRGAYQKIEAYEQLLKERFGQLIQSENEIRQLFIQLRQTETDFLGRIQEAINLLENGDLKG